MKNDSFELKFLGEYSKCLNKRKRRSVEDEFDPFDDYEAQLEQGERATAVVRLSDTPSLALRQVKNKTVQIRRHDSDREM